MNDYIGDDGLLYCGDCHTPKEAIINHNGKDFKVPIMCRCREDKVAAEREHREHEKKLTRIDQARLNSMIDTNYSDSRFRNAIITSSNERQLRIAKQYCQKFDEMMERNQGLMFYGSVGTGKSFVAACIANELLDREYTVVMTSFVKILEDMKSNQIDESSYLRRLNSVDLIIVDDLGAERNTDYALEKVFGVIDDRYRAKKPMLLTTNLNLQYMRSCQDIRYSRIYDRVFEMCYPVEFTGLSWRKHSAKLNYDKAKSELEG